MSQESFEIYQVNFGPMIFFKDQKLGYWIKDNGIQQSLWIDKNYARGNSSGQRITVKDLSEKEMAAVIREIWKRQGAITSPINRAFRFDYGGYEIK